jgi:hypothetical protein
MASSCTSAGQYPVQRPRPAGSAHVRLAEAAENGDGLGDIKIGLSGLPRRKIVDSVVFDANTCARYVRLKPFLFLILTGRFVTLNA